MRASVQQQLHNLARSSFTILAAFWMLLTIPSASLLFATQPLAARQQGGSAIAAPPVRMATRSDLQAAQDSSNDAVTGGSVEPSTRPVIDRLSGSAFDPYAARRRTQVGQNSERASSPATESSASQGSNASAVLPAAYPIGDLDENQGDGDSLDEWEDSTALNRTGIPLARPSQSSRSTDKTPSSKLPDSKLTNTLVSLAVVLGGFFLLVWFVKKSRPTAFQGLPSDTLEVLGRAPFSGKQQFQLVRFGNKLLLMVVGGTSTQTVSEITDPDEVERLIAICSRNRPGSISDTFRQVLAQLGQEKTNLGFLDEPEESTSPRRRSRSGESRGSQIFEA